MLAERTLAGPGALGAADDAAPRSSEQERTLRLLAAAPGALRVRGAVEVASGDGAVDGARLAQAFADAVERADLLRASGAPIWRRLAVDDAEVEARTAAFFDAPEFPGSPAVGELLVRDRPGAPMRLLVSLPPLAADRATLRLFVRDLARAAGADSAPPAAPYPYSDYVAWQRDLLASEDAAPERAFWRRVDPALAADAGLAAVPAESAEPPGPPGPPGAPAPSRSGSAGRFDPRPIRLALEPAVERRLAAADGADWALAAWVALLCRLAGRREAVVAVGSAGREYEALVEAPGPFARFLPIRFEVAWDAPLDRLAVAVAGERAAAAAFEDAFTWSDLEPSPAGDVDAAPLTPALLFEGVANPAAAGRGAFALIAERVVAEPALLALRRFEATDRHGAALEVEVDASRLPLAEAERLGGRFATLLAAAVARPATPVGDLPILPDAERRLLLVDLNDTACDLSAAPLDELVRAAAARTPERVAVRDARGEVAFGVLVERVRALAARLVAAGVGPERPVALCAERSAELVVGLLAILEAGGAFLPLDPDHPVERLAAILDDVRPAVALVGRGAPGALFAERGLALFGLDRALEPAAEPPAWTPERRQLSRSADLDRLAYVLFTSGSTGRPKGVMVRHGAIVNRLLWQQAAHPLTAGDRVLQKTPIGFDASIWELFLPLLAGAELVLAAPGSHRDAEALARAVDASGITVLQLVPSLLPAFLDEVRPGSCRSLRLLFCGGEELPSDLVRRAQAELGAEVVNFYGPTEAAIDAASWPCREGLGPRSAPIGRPIANDSLVLVDPRFQPVPAGLAGEIAIGGSGLARGYFGRPDLTAERFVPDPFSGALGARLYRTGDLARHLPGGEIEYLGRIDRQVKIRGVRVELGEIEIQLRAHPSVREAVVVARRLPDAGERDELRLVAFAVPREAGGLRGADLGAYLAGRLPEAMVPAAFVELAALPTLPNGKLDLRALPEAPSGVRSPAAGAAGEAARPTSEIAQLVAAVWVEILGGASPALDDDFFARGGHSLAATRLAARLGRRFGIDFPLQEVFDRPTLGAQVAAVEAALLGGSAALLPPLAPRDRAAANGELGEELPLSFAQQRLWFFERMRPGTATFNIAVAFRLRGDLRIAALRAAFAAVVARHEMLRTTFPDRRGRPVQVVRPAVAIGAPLVDLAGLAPGRREGELVRGIAAAGVEPFDLATGPLLRLRLFRLAAREHALASVVHHIASDAWSSGVLTRELATVYRTALDRAAPPPLPPLPIQYGDYALWQRAWPEEVLAAQLDYWRRELAGAPPLLELPADRPRPEAFSYRGATRALELSAELSTALGALARRLGATTFMILFAGFEALLGRLSGRTDFVVGTDVAGRRREETEGLIGFFINQLPLRADLSGDPTFLELLERVRRTALAAYAHQDLPFEVLVDALKVPRTVGHAPLFQVKLFFENTPGGDYGFPEVEIAQIDAETPVAKLDLTIALWQRGERIRGWLNYATDLFDGARIDRLAARFVDLLAAAAARPEAHLSSLFDQLKEIEHKELAMEKKDLKDLSFKKWKAVAPKAVAISEELVEKSYLAPDQKLPLVVRPRVPDVDLAEWAGAHKEEIESDLREHGAVLFRGFGIDEPEALEAFASKLCPTLFNENGEHPRDSVSGNVYTPVFYPPDQRLLWHNENSFNWSWPRVIFFACARPAETGGSTPIVDSRRVYRELDPAIRERWERLGVRYQRNYAEGLGLPWQTVFRADSREEVEHSFQGSHMHFDWRDGDRLCTLADRPAVIPHPQTGEMCWMNQAQHWHVHCLDEATRESMRSLFSDRDLPRHCYFGDGSPIPDEDMEAILALYERLEVAFPWQKGDVIMVDNVLCAHGRNPFTGPRKILVAMGHMTSYDEV